MVNLAAELLEAELSIIDRQTPGYLKKLEAIFLRRQKSKSNESCLLICPGPEDLLSLLQIKDWRKRFRYTAAWIIDSFWIDRIPKVAKLSQLFDRLFVTTEEDILEWTQVMKTPTTWLPWGTDALRLGGKGSERVCDLTRIGRQPPEWENDSVTQKLCLENNIQFQGRIKSFDSARKNQEVLMGLYRQTKFLLAFSNSINPTKYTHPSREYLTARWTDALACGAVVVGVPPKEPSINRLLWSDATLDLGSVRIEDGLEVISEAVRTWSAEQAERNYQESLKRLDWRWRFATIADFANESPQRLNDELQLLQQRIEQCIG
jgi:hypothetical protein